LSGFAESLQAFTQNSMQLNSMQFTSWESFRKKKYLNPLPRFLKAKVWSYGPLASYRMLSAFESWITVLGV